MAVIAEFRPRHRLSASAEPTFPGCAVPFRSGSAWPLLKGSTNPAMLPSPLFRSLPSRLFWPAFGGRAKRLNADAGCRDRTPPDTSGAERRIRRKNGVFHSDLKGGEFWLPAQRAQFPVRHPLVARAALALAARRLSGAVDSVCRQPFVARSLRDRLVVRHVEDRGLAPFVRQGHQKTKRRGDIIAMRLV